MPSSYPSAEHRVSISELRRLCRKYWLQVLVVFVAGTVGMWAAFPIFLQDLYRTQVRLLVKIGRENTETPDTVQNGQIFSQGVRVADINSEVEILSSRALIETVVDKIGLEAFRSVLEEPKSWTGYPKYYAKLAARGAKRWYKEFLIQASIKKRLSERDEDVLAVAKGVEVEPVRDSDILILKVSTPGADLSVRVARAMLEEYFLVRQRARGNSAGTEFFERRTMAAKESLEKLQQARAEVRTRWGVDSPAEQRTQDLERLNQLRTQLKSTEVEAAKLRKEQEVMGIRSQALPKVVDRERVEGTNPGIRPIQERLTELKVERAKLATRYQPGSEMLKKTETEIAELEGVLSNQPSTIVSSVTTESNPTKRSFEAGLDQYNVQVAGLDTRRREIAAQLPELERRSRDITVAMDELEGADREYKRVEKEYLTYSQKLEEARMSDALDSRRVANVVAVEEPETPIEPSYPNKLFLMEIAMAVSLILGIALAAVLETTEDRILDEASLAAAGNIVCLGTVNAKRVA